MRIRMLQTRLGTENGFTLHEYKREQVYEVNDLLGRAFLAAGYAVKVLKKRHNTSYVFVLGHHGMGNQRKTTIRK